MGLRLAVEAAAGRGVKFLLVSVLFAMLIWCLLNFIMFMDAIDPHDDGKIRNIDLLFPASLLAKKAKPHVDGFLEGLNEWLWTVR